MLTYAVSPQRDSLVSYVQLKGLGRATDREAMNESQERFRARRAVGTLAE
jgi:hypothetical protein